MHGADNKTETAWLSHITFTRGATNDLSHWIQSTSVHSMPISQSSTNLKLKKKKTNTRLPISEPTQTEHSIFSIFNCVVREPFIRRILRVYIIDEANTAFVRHFGWARTQTHKRINKREYTYAHTQNTLQEFARLYESRIKITKNENKEEEEVERIPLARWRTRSDVFSFHFVKLSLLT